MRSIKVLRIVGFLEGISYLLLLGLAMPLKYGADIPQLISPIGMAHGVLFVAYILLVLINWYKFKWRFSKAFLAGIASLLPFGTFVADKKLFREN
jgi:integral membrane protein